MLAEQRELEGGLMKRPCFPRVFSCFAKGALLMRHAPVILIASLYSLLAPPWTHVAISFAGSTTGRGVPTRFIPTTRRRATFL